MFVVESNAPFIEFFIVGAVSLSLNEVVIVSIDGVVAGGYVFFSLES